MNGNRYLLDTNAIISILKPNSDSQTWNLQNTEWVGISIISKIEFLSYKKLTPTEKDIFEKFEKRVDVVGIDANSPQLLNRIIEIRNNSSLKLPDAIIAATALENKSTLITADKHFLKVEGLKIFFPFSISQ